VYAASQKFLEQRALRARHFKTLKLQNIMKTIILRRFGTAIYLPVFVKLFEKHNLIFFADFRCA
jgi:hypothetical protein